jgi:ribonuclease-3
MNVETDSPEQARLKRLEEVLQYTFVKPELGIGALVHRSYLNEHRGDVGSHNESLEFLGDAVLSLLISQRLMERFPEASEGELSRLRALLVNEEGLACVARSIGLGDLVLLGKGEERTGGRNKSSVLADALEAVLGAVYLSSGLQDAQQTVDRLFATRLEGVAEGRSGFDYKTHLQEQAQLRLRQAPRYRVVAETGPDHAKTFEVEVMVGSSLSARAFGRSKKEAEQAAAQKMLASVPELANAE